MSTFNKKSAVSLKLSIALALSTATISPTSFAAEFIDSRIRPAQQIQITSSNDELNYAIAESIDFVYDSLVVGPQQYPTVEVEDRVVKFRDAGLPAVPSLWGSYHGTPSPVAQGYRENFCLRDIAHQTEGASILSLNEENINMLERFAFDALQDKRIAISSPNLDPLDPWASANDKSYWQQYWTLWSYNFYGFPYYMDAGFQELPAPLELLEKIYTMYEYSGDARWLSDTFIAYGRMIQNEFTDRYDFNGNGVVDNRGNEGILPTLWEFEGASHLTEGDDVVYDNSTSPATLIIKKSYFERLGVQDIGLKVRFRNGKDDYLNIRVNNVADTNGVKPLISNDYIFIETGETITAKNITLNIANGVTLQTVTDGSTVLTAGSDYTVAGNVVTLTKAYLESIPASTSYRIKSSIGFNFSDGAKENVVIAFDSHKHVTIPLLDKTDITLDWNNLQDVVLKVDMSQTSGDNKDLYRIENGMNRVVEAGDTLGVQYQATLAFEGMLRAKAKLAPEQANALNTEADIYQNKAAALLETFRTKWYNAETGTYARAFDGYGNAIYGWGHENSFFMAMKEMLEPGQKADDYLQFIHENSEGLNEEAITYLPEAFYNYGKNQEGWYWLQSGLERFYTDRTEAKKESTYPEIAFTNVSNIVTYMMGYDPKVHENTIETLSRLPTELEFVQVDNLPVGQSFTDVADYNRSIDNLVNLKHQGTHTSTLSSSVNSADTLTWKAQFAANTPYLYVDGYQMAASTININGVTVSYVEVDLARGESKTVSTIKPEVLPVTPLSDLSATSIITGWGVTQMDASIANNTITLDGQSYDKGIGTHTNSEIAYDLKGSYNRFTAIVGIDDEVGNNGSAVFKIYLDGVLSFDSGLLTGADSSQAISIDVTGALEMVLVAEDGGDGMSNDHADWANPTLLIQSQSSLLNLEPESITQGWGTTKFNQSIDGNTLSIAGISYEQGIGTHASGEVIYFIGGEYTSFSAVVGLDDETGNNGSVTFQVYVDNTLAFDSGELKGDDASGTYINVDVTGASELRLVTLGGADGISYDHADWAIPMLTK